MAWVIESSKNALNVMRQGATIRLPNCSGQSIFGLGDHDLQKSCPSGQVQIISKLTLILSHTLQTSKTILIIPTNHQHILTFQLNTYVLASLGKEFYGQACPTGQPRKKKLSQLVLRLSITKSGLQNTLYTSSKDSCYLIG